MENPATAYNRRQFMGVKIDIYRVLYIFGITHPAQQHAIKKLLRAGKGHKDLERDIAETIETLERWQAMLAEEREEELALNSAFRPPS